MTDGWIERLVMAIKDSGYSYSKLSQEAGLGRNFVQQFIKYKKDPGTQKLTQLLNVLGPGKSIYVMTGLRVSDDDVDFLEAMAALSPDARKHAAQLLRSLVSTPSMQEPEPAER